MFMKIYEKLIEIIPGAGFAVQNITHLVNDFVSSVGVVRGQLVLFYKHTTGSIIIGEHETGIVADLEDAFEAIAPTDGEYLHHQRDVDFNGFAHIRAAIMPTSVVIPISGGKLVLGTHQEILVVDNQPEELPRFVFLQITGE
jgi:secondary thiamine-phosphate synthase enzyme